MSLLASADALAVRREVAAGPLAGLATGLRAELQPLVDAPPQVPTAKALLSREGGRCARDGTLLRYEPFTELHLCPRCGAEYTGGVHDRFRLYWHQLWLAERTVHAALLGVLLDDREACAVAITLLDRFAAQYLRYPNADNVLGPSRPFFSTYLESIWLLQLSIALDLLETGARSSEVSALGARVRDSLVAPSAALIASYDEGMSNRQVWNNAALVAAGILLGDRGMTERALYGASGLRAHLEVSLLADGSWYEGENYHLFAHRGLWYGVTMAEQEGLELPAALVQRFQEGFAAPFRTLLPDLTYPSRRDSQYAISVRQPRFAESCELGLARAHDERLAGMLARLYDPGVPRGETHRASSSGDVERNWPGTGLSRADLGWRALLVARGELPLLRPVALRSDLLPAQGFGILRREETALYLALDYGHSGGGHGHPDRLNVLFSQGDVRWMDDPGTGSYVDPSLHWYRSTLAHTAPLVDGASQPRTNGELVAFADEDDAAWISAQARLAGDLFVRRCLVLADGYLVDTLRWRGQAPHEIALPLHGARIVDAGGAPLKGTPASLLGSDGIEDGFRILRDSRLLLSGERAFVVQLRLDRDGRALQGWGLSPAGAEWWGAMAPGTPADPAPRPMLLQRASAAEGELATVWCWDGRVASAARDVDGIVVTLASGERHRHRETEEGWRIEMQRGHDRRVLVLPRRELPSSSAESTRLESSLELDASCPPPLHLPATLELGELHYRRSERSWDEAESPRALVTISRAGPAALEIRVEVPRSARAFVAPGTENLLDNEPAAINGDSVQLYLEAGSVKGGWLLVPVAGTAEVFARTVDGWGAGLGVTATWEPSATGYLLTAVVPIPAGTPTAALDVLVNETAPGRARRRGQLVLSGARGEFVYLRGDRHDPDRLVRLSLADD